MTQVDPLVHLHRHSEYSFLDGVGTATHFAEEAKRLGQGYLSITDHGNLCGALLHVKACEEAGITPILGMEAYFRPQRSDWSANNGAYYHLVLLAKNLEGWQNLMRLHTESYMSGYGHKKPVIDFELLRMHGKGLIGSTSCVAGVVPKRIIEGDIDGARDVMEILRDTFEGHLFAEIQPHQVIFKPGDPCVQKLVNREIYNLANELSVPLVATADVHYPYKDWYETQDLLVMTNTGQTVATREKAHALGEDYMSGYPTCWLMSSQEMRELFALNHPELDSSIVDEAIGNTGVVASWIEQFEIDKSPKIPKAADTPEEAEAIVMGWAREGLERIGKSGDPIYEARLEHERNILRNAAIFDYFYIIGDLVRWAKGLNPDDKPPGRPIRVGACRGSAGGSLIAYTTRITAIDPVGHGLLFERFLNPDRKELPDIDIDFQHNRREECKEYLARKWGQERVANVAAFQMFGMASSLQSMAKVLQADFVETKAVTDKLQGAVKDADAATEDEGELHLEDLLPHSSALQEYAAKNPEVWKHALRLEGQVRTMGQHPAGVVITPGPSTESMPTMKARKDGHVVSAWSERASFPIMTTYGFLKIDALSTDGLTIQDYAADLIEKQTGEVIDFEDPRQFPVIVDPYAVETEVIEKFGAGRTLGVFQFESHGITGLLKDIKPDWLGDVIAANALYRPGPLDGGTTFQYGKRKNGQQPWSNVHPSLDPILDSTYGIIAYQEQVMAVASAIGGFSPAEADDVRKIMTKWHSNKDNTRRGEEKMRQMQDRFFEHATGPVGLAKKEAEQIWEWLKAFARYGFNKSHAGGYALQAYQDMWLKVHHPLAFYASLLTWEPKKTARVVRAALADGVDILPPDVNRSSRGFTIDNGAIRFGLTAIRDVGLTSVIEIERMRPFTDYADMMRKVNTTKVNAKVKLGLLEAGAFDEWGGRSQWMIATETLREPDPNHKRRYIYHQRAGDVIPGSLSQNEMAALEKLRIGFPLSTSAQSAKVSEDVKSKLLIHTVADLEGVQEGDTKIGEDNITIGGEVIEIREQKSKWGNDIAFVKTEYEGDEYQLLFQSRAWTQFRDQVEEGVTILAQGKMGDDKLIVNNMITMEQARAQLA